MMIVVPDAEPLFDQVADHRTGPNARLITGLHRPEADDDSQRLALFVGELRRRPLRDPSPKPVDVIGVVPLEPPVHRAPRDSVVSSDGGYLSSADVRTNSTSTTPLTEVVLQLRFEDELVELFQLSATAPCPSNCLPWLRSSHDRRTMILSGSFVNR